jgi:methylthioribulose-1-phosphate dehydratase
MPDPARFAVAAEQIAAAGRWLYQRGWSPATSSNYSLRLDAGSCAITSSGCDKERLAADQVMVVDLDGRPLGSGRPSAETLLHTRLYRRWPEVGAVLHTHSVGATVLSRLVGAGQTLVLEGYELAKAFPGINDHCTPLRLPVLANSQDMTVLADAADAVLDADIRAYLICGHGLYTWGPDLATVRRQVEALEFLFACELELRRAR